MQERRDNSAIFSKMDSDREYINKKVETINIKQASMGEQIKTIEDSTTRIEKKLDDFICSCDTKYAFKKETETRFENIEKERLSKLERVVYGGVGVILVAFLGALIGLVFVK